MKSWHGTTIIMVRKGGQTVIGGDGQVTIGQTIIKGNAKKVRRLAKGEVIGGFAGATADALPCSNGLRPSSNNIPANWCAPASNSPRTGAPTVICAGWKP